MNTYKWVVSSLDAKIEDGELSNVIETVHYRYQATDADGNVADVYGSVGLESPDAESFIAHEDLTQADVEAWLEAKLDVESMQAGLDAQLDAIANPIHVSLSLSEAQ
jgi:hypothetical protein